MLLTQTPAGHQQVELLCTGEMCNIDTKCLKWVLWPRFKRQGEALGVSSPLCDVLGGKTTSCSPQKLLGCSCGCTFAFSHFCINRTWAISHASYATWTSHFNVCSVLCYCHGLKSVKFHVLVFLVFTSCFILFLPSSPHFRPRLPPFVRFSPVSCYLPSP